MTLNFRFAISLLLASALVGANPAYAVKPAKPRSARTTRTAPAKPAQKPAPQPEEDENDEEEEDDADRAVREGKVEIPAEADDIDIPIPAFVKADRNVIDLNGADWNKLRTAFRNSDKRTVSIVHIGDSHVQAEINTGTVRSLLQYDFGNAGRGLISPHRLSGSNQADDYQFQSSASWVANKLMSPKWQQTVGFTGSSIRPVAQTSEITVGTCGRDDYNPFTSVTLFHSGKISVTSVTNPEGKSLEFRAIPSKDYTQIILHSQQHSVTVHFTSAGDLTLFGASLSGDRPGVFYHAIGNNGAVYDTYNRIGNVGAGIAPLRPDLVIVSLGTNEAFGKFNTASFRSAIDRLVSNIRAANPQAQILLTTPMECQRSVLTSKKVKVKSKARRGRRAKTRSVTRTTRSYAVNANIAPARDAILAYGRENGIPVYDWYAVAGGKGASATWIANGLFAPDRVHHTHKGYNIEGRLIYEALMSTLRSR